MNMLVNVETASLPSLIDRAANALVNARSAAEVLEARDMASVAYDAAKKAARLSKAKGAADALIAAAHRAQADALEIEAGAKRRLADEYDDAQERGEVATRSDQNLLQIRRRFLYLRLALHTKPSTKRELSETPRKPIRASCAVRLMTLWTPAKNQLGPKSIAP